MTAPQGSVRNRPYDDRLVPAAPPRVMARAAVLTLSAVAGGTAILHPAAPLVVGAFVAVAVVAWQRPLAAAIAVVAFVPALSGLARGLGVPQLKLSEVLLLLATALLVLRRPELGQRFRAVDWGLLVFAVAGAGFAAVHVLSGVSDAGTFVRVGLQPAMLFMIWWTASRSTRSEQDLRVVLRWLLCVSVVPAALTVLQSLDAPGVRALLIRLTAGPSLPEPGFEGAIRATGPFPIWHSLAAYLLPVIAVGVVLLLRRDRMVLPWPALMTVLLLAVAALVLSLTMTVIAWAAVTVLVVALLQRRLLEAMALLVVAAAVSGVLFAAPISARIEQQFAPRDSATSEAPATIAYRLEVWQRDFLPLMERAVPYGIGNELPESVLFQNTENQYISLMLRGGILFLLSGLAAMVLAAAAVAGVASRPRELSGATAGAALGVIVFLPLACLIWPYVTNAGFPQAWLSVAGAAVGAAAGRRSIA